MRVFLIDLRIALRSLFQHSRRTLFLGSAIAGVTALYLLLGGLTTGVKHTLMTTATTLSSGHLNVGGFFKVSAGQSAPVVSEAPRVMAATKAALPEMAFAVQRGRGWAKIISEEGSMQSALAGIELREEPKFKSVLHIVEGNVDDLDQPNTILIFENQAKKLNVKLGDALTVSAQTSRGISNTIDVRVAAIARDVGLMSKFNAFIPMRSLRALYQMKPDVTGVIQIHLPEEQMRNMGALAARLRTSLAQAGFRVMEPSPQAFWQKITSVNREDWTGQKLDVTSWEDELSFISWTVGVLQGLSFLLLIILIAIVVTGIMNTMWISIRERTREIGTIRAIGMQRWGVLRMFLLESLCLGFLSTIAGGIVGSVVAGIVNAMAIKVPFSMQLFLMSDRVRLLVEPAAVIVAVLFITFVTAVAAFFPALRAARLRPVVAMSHFG